MLRWIVLAVVVVVLTAAATFLSVNAPDSEITAVPAAPVNVTGPHPTVEVPGPLIHDFGTMAQLSEGTHTWEFKNTGDADLELWFESSTCSCTVAKLKSADGEEKKKLIIKPKASNTIDLEWQTKLFRDEYQKGATIGTNDPHHPAVSIGVKGKVYPPVVVLPTEAITFGTVSNDDPHTAKLAIFSVDRPDMKITRLSNSRPAFLVASQVPLSPEECQHLKVKAGHTVTLEMKPGMPIGRFADDLVIHTDHPRKPQVTVSISGNVTGPISVIPDRVRIQNVSSSQGAVRDVAIIVRGGTPTKFTVDQHPDRTQVEITPDDSTAQKGRYKLTVSVPPGTPAGPVEGEIVIKTDHPSASVLKIPVSILISNSAG